MFKVMRRPRRSRFEPRPILTPAPASWEPRSGRLEGAPRGSPSCFECNFPDEGFASARSCSSATDDIAASRALAKAADACDDATALGCRARSGRDFAEPDREANPDAVRVLRHRSAHWGQAFRDKAPA